MTVRWGERKTFKAQSSPSKALARGKVMHYGPSKRVAVVMRLKRWVRPDHAGPYRLYKDLSSIQEQQEAPKMLSAKHVT